MEHAMRLASDVSDDDQTLYELETEAPVIGSVLPLDHRTVQPDTWPRLPDVAADAVAAEAFHLAASSLVGLAHASAGTSRQDAYDFGISTDGALFFVVADGLGSRPTSHLGAALFCESIILAAVVADADIDPLDLAIVASERTVRVAEDAYALSAKDIPCAVLVGVVANSAARLVRVGDTTAFLMHGDVFTEVFPYGSNFVNVVDAVMPGDLGAAAEVVNLPMDAPLVVVSDGLATDIRTSPAVRQWLSTRWRGPLGPHAMADSLRYRRQGSHDDRTALVVWPSPLLSSADAHNVEL
jgi:hypothetical protein